MARSRSRTPKRATKVNDHMTKIGLNFRFTDLGLRAKGSVHALSLGLALFCAPSAVRAAAQPYGYKSADLNQVRNQASETMIMPASFLREFDPITILYGRDMHPAGAGPLDQPDQFLSIRPAPQGEYRWLDARTVEFRPAAAWKPMQVYTVKAGNETRKLTALLAPPTGVSPSPGSKDLAPFSRVQLEFAQPVDPEILAKLVTFETVPLPGIETKNVKVYGASDFVVKASERSTNGSASYAFVFKRPFPTGMRVRTVVRLAADAIGSDAKRVYLADTRKEFSLERAGSYDYQFTLNPSGSSYNRDQAIRMGHDGSLIFDFSATPSGLTLSQVKSLLNFSPAPKRMDWSLSGNRLTVRLAVEQERVYNVVVSPTNIKDADGRKLQLDNSCSFYFFQPLERQVARWGLGKGLVERFGPQHFPLLVSGFKSLDLRAYKIDPFHKAFWPFPNGGVRVNETASPPGPGEEPVSQDSITAPLNTTEIVKHIRMLGAPPYSQVVDLEKDGVTRFQNLDLKAMFAKISGKDQPGTYLVGFRPLDGSTDRSFVRIQVTDLSLSSVESKKEILFTVTSISSGKPVYDAEVSIEGLSKKGFALLAKGRTNADGMFVLAQTDANFASFVGASVKRVSVRYSNDVLVLDGRASEAPPEFSNNHWYGDRSSWLEWLSRQPYDFSKDQVSAGFVFTERPIYRPNETIYFKAIVRTLFQGAIREASSEGKFNIHIQSPSGVGYDFPVGLSASNTYDDSLCEKDLPTGEYDVSVQRVHPKSGKTILASTSFKVEAYRLPKFEVKLQVPDKARNDRSQPVKLNASYYAGGKVSGQKVAWKVVSYPYSYAPKGLQGYILSTDGRYGAVTEERQEGVVESADLTDENGQSVLNVNPQSATNGNPRRYVCEATVTDVDDQTVSNRASFVALPPFVLGLKTNRHVTGSSTIKVDVAALSFDGGFEVGQKVSVSLKKMSWISYLQETDFARGKPKYRTQESMELVSEKTVTTAKGPTSLSFENRDPGVYVVELSARDRLGRLQSVKADLFLAGDKPVTWKKSEQMLFETVPDKDSYQPGQVAKILLKSPYQRAMALAVVERPSGVPEYHWVEVANGQAEFALPILPEMAPKIPVSFLLMRARISDEKRTPDGSTVDAGRPQTVANTTWITVDQIENQLKVALEHAASVRPGTTIPVTIDLKDAKGQARSGEVALWLVDEAVLSLAKEKPLDPLAAFTAKVLSHLSIRDVRNMLIGDLRVSENPGGDGSEGGMDGFFGKMTVRKNFKSVPYWNPSIQVGASGKATVNVPISDDLTNFAVRAVAVSGMDRFGTGTSQIRVRLPVLVQPALPRFVRLGDKFKAGGVARVVEGPGGAATWSIKADGLKLSEGTTGTVALDATKPSPLKTEFVVMEPGFDANGNLRYDSVAVKMGVERTSDRAADAFSVKLPVKMDRPYMDERSVVELRAEKPLSIPAIAHPARPGTVSRQILLSNQMGILKAISAMASLVQYPYGCSEQLISRAYPAMLYRGLWAKYGLEAPAPNIGKIVATTIDQLARAQGSDGLIAYWPGSNGYVHLTAYAVEFLTEVKRANETAKAGYAFDDGLYRKSLEALKRALRSDYSRFVSGEVYYERTSALLALAKAGELDVGYARELAMQTTTLDVQAQAKVYEALQKNSGALKLEIASLSDKLWGQTVFKTESGREVFGGLQQRSFRIGERVHTNEITALASMVGAFASAPNRSPKLPMLVDELVNLADQEDWGSTQANSASLLALRNYLTDPVPSDLVTTTLSLGAGNEKVNYDGRSGAVSRTWSDAAKADVRVDKNGKTPLFARYTERYLPQAPGSQADAEQKGFVVKRELVFIDRAKGDRRVPLDKSGTEQVLQVGDIVEEHIRIENPKNRAFVAVSAPFAAGLEYMNPRLETSGSDAAPTGKTTNSGTYQSFQDDKIDFFFENLPAGTYDFYFRLRATVEGEFSHPSARAEMMYEMGTYGTSPGAKIVVQPVR
ncbi:MAG: hypothetical protein RL173_539 [Fibrobacterota bacterium]